MNALYESMTQIGLTGERHLFGLTSQEQEAIRQATKVGMITLGAYQEPMLNRWNGGTAKD